MKTASPARLRIPVMWARVGAKRRWLFSYLSYAAHMRQLFIGSREACLNASRSQEQAAHSRDELCLWPKGEFRCLLLLVRPEAIADFEHIL
jgi:hypothetical protein